MAVKHSRDQIRRADNDDLLVCQQLASTVSVEQCGRAIILASRDITLLDQMIPYEAKFSSASDLLVIKVRRRDVECRVGNTQSLNARVIPSASGTSSIVSAYMRALSQAVGDLAGQDIHLIESQLLDLIAVCLSAEGRRRPAMSTARSAALLNLRCAIQSNLADRSLDAEKIAHLAHISVRYANSLLAAEQTSLMRLVLKLRLERCASALSDPARRRRTIGQIAYGWGFADLTHFGRAFKAVYGVLPRDYREMRTDCKADVVHDS